MSGFDITSLINVPVLILCFLAGYLIKNFTGVPNKYIPLIVSISGAIVGVIVGLSKVTEINAESVIISIISGGVSGLASTGSYEFIVNTLGLKKKKSDSEETIEEHVIEEDSTEPTEEDIDTNVSSDETK